MYTTLPVCLEIHVYKPKYNTDIRVPLQLYYDSIVLVYQTKIIDNLCFSLVLIGKMKYAIN